MSTPNENIGSLDFTESDRLLEEIIEITTGYMQTPSHADIRRIITETYHFARDAHGEQRRKSGEPYITHPLEATKILLPLKPDLVSIQSCILHDVIEDTPRTKEDIEAAFGEKVADICQGLSKLSAIRYHGEERTIESLRKMLIAMVDDLRVIIVKLADRLHNMRTLDFHPDPKKRERIALETLNIYAPIADRLGIFGFKEMLETECFRILHPKELAHILDELAGLTEEQEFFLREAKKMIRGVLDDSIPIFDISYRIKSPYSIYKKLQRKRFEYTNVHDLYDLFAVRIITDNIRHCYEILGILHNMFIPMPKRFKDYIALPKENGYRSLHTAVAGIFPDLRSQPTEIQIRTQEMHEHAEVGVAAHFTYSETGQSKESQDTYWVEAIKDIIGENQGGLEFMSDMKINVFDDQIFVFTPKGDIVTLPRGATPVDFAYAIHSELGNTLTVAKVDGQVVPLDYSLRSGQHVSIVTDKNKRPRPIWLSFVATSKARDHIRQFLNREEREIFIDKGRNILNAYLEKNYGKGLDKDLTVLRIIDGNVLDTRQKEDILVQIGNLSRKPGSVLKTIHDEIIRDLLGERVMNVPQKKTRKTSKKTTDNTDESQTVIIGKERDVPYRIAQCCHPTPKDKKIVGIIGQGIVTIHNISCENVDHTDLDRRIPARWENEPEGQVMQFTIECVFYDRRGMLMELSQIFFQFGLNIQGFHIEHQGGGLVKNRFTLETQNDDYYIYDRLEARLRFELPEIREISLVTID